RPQSGRCDRGDWARELRTNLVRGAERIDSGDFRAKVKRGLHPIPFFSPSFFPNPLQFAVARSWQSGIKRRPANLLKHPGANRRQRGRTVKQTRATRHPRLPDAEKWRGHASCPRQALVAASSAMRRRRKIRLVASAAGHAVQARAEVDESGFNREERVVERRLDGIELLGRLIACLGFSLDLLRRLDRLDRGYAIVRAEDRDLAGIEPYVAKHRTARMIGIRNGILQVGLPHRLDGLVGGHSRGDGGIAACGRARGSYQRKDQRDSFCKGRPDSHGSISRRSKWS